MEQIEDNNLIKIEDDNKNNVLIDNPIIENPLKYLPIEYEKTCPHCKKIFKTISKKKVFHSKSCCDKYYALKRYYSLKDNPDYKTERTKRNKLYYKTHRKEFLAKMKVYGKNYYQKKKEILKEALKIINQDKINNGLNSKQE